MSEKNDVSLHWIPAHCGYPGNKYVDGLAKKGSEMTFVGPQPSITASLCLIRAAIKSWARKMHVSWWSGLDSCRQTKILLTAPYGGPHDFMRATRKQIRLLTYIVTGHATLNSHLWKMGLVESPVCNQCGLDDETVSHFMGYCEAYMTLRYQIFGAHTMGLKEMFERPLPTLIKFIVNSGRFTSQNLAPNEVVGS